MHYLALVLLALLAGLFRAVHDAQTFTPGCLARWGAWFDNRESWRRKYRHGDPTAGPAFPGATTWLVGWTDAWHASNTLSWLCADAALLLLAWPAYHWLALVPVVGRRVVFEPVYSYLRKSA